MTGEFCLSDNTKRGRLINLAKEISSNSDNILYFKNVVINYHCIDGQLTVAESYSNNSTSMNLKKQLPLLLREIAMNIKLPILLISMVF